MVSEKEKLKSALIKIKKIIEPAIERILLSEVDHKFHQIVKYQISTGGKRLRPALAIITSKMLGGKLKDVLYPAAGLEILHNYTLIVDDIIDHSLFRRNQPTVWAKYGKSITECIAINFASAIFQSARQSLKSSEISELFAKTMKIIAGGEIIDILFERRGREEEPYIVKNRPKTISQEQYIEMVSKKTAYLFQASCEIGGICAQADKKEIELLKKYGFNLGVAFQIQDDILDIFGKEKEFGKKIGKDIEERKGGNIVLMLARQEINPKEKERIDYIMKKSKITKRETEETISLVQKTKGREKAFMLGEAFINKAKNNLSLLPQNKWNRLLAILADFVIAREK